MATKIYANARFGLREDTLENWTANNPVLERGEPAAVRDGSESEWLKIGDGATPFNDLPWKKGPKGDKGETGEQGAKGEKGDKGDKGEDADLTYINSTFAGSLKGTASGEVIRIDDVSPVEHEVKVTLESINLAVPNDFVVENNGMTATTNPDGTITVTGSVADGTQATLLQLIFRKRETEFIPLEIGQVYKIVVKKYGASILAFGTKTVYTDTGEMYWGTVETTDIMRPRKVQLVYLQKNLAEGDTSLCGTYTVQLVKGTKVGEYTPYVQVENVKLSRCGRNLIAYTDETKTVGGSGVTVIKTKNSAAFTINGTATVDASIVATSPMLLPAGTYTASVDGLNTVSTNFDRCYVWDVLAGKVIVNDIMTGKPKTFTLTESTTVRIDFVFASGTSYENKVVTVQLQEGETASEWEEYNNATYTPETDGTVKGVTALSPNMTFITDTAGVTINCEYNRDINAAFAELQQAIISLGGNV